MDGTTPSKLRYIRRVGLLGDIHGHSAELTTALTHLKELPDLDALLCTGDIPGMTVDGDSNHCCRLLEENRVIVVRGNHDRWAVENAESRVLLGLSDEWPLAPGSNQFLRSLPPTYEFETALGLVLLCHGTGSDDLTGLYPGDGINAFDHNHALHALYREERVRLLVCGHTHQRMVRQLDHLTILNASSLAWEKIEGLPMRTSPGTALRHKNPCFAVVDFEQRAAQFYNIDRVTHAIREAERFSL